MGWIAPVLPHPKALILDLDDTIVDWSGTLAVAWGAVCDRIAKGQAARLLKASVAYNLLSEPGRDATDVFRRCLADLGIPAPSDITSVFEGFDKVRFEATRPLNGAVQAIRDLRGRVSKLSVLTNGNPDHQREKLARTGVAELFDAVLTSGDVGIEKGDDKIYQIALQQLGVEATDAWMVGDSLEMDVAVPQKLGMKGIWVVWPASKYRYMPLLQADLPQNLHILPDLVVKRLADLVHFIGRED